MAPFDGLGTTCTVEISKRLRPNCSLKNNQAHASQPLNGSKAGPTLSPFSPWFEGKPQGNKAVLLVFGDPPMLPLTKIIYGQDDLCPQNNIGHLVGVCGLTGDVPLDFPFQLERRYPQKTLTPNQVVEPHKRPEVVPNQKWAVLRSPAESEQLF